ncbi:MAG: hypothetical protein J4432_03545 [DPANN group archaeon]|nr:hypothetical protein [DPANN group archaeon]
MAKPIRPTPTLRGDDAIKFLKNMLLEEKKPNPKRIKFIEDSLKIDFKAY